MKSYGTNIKSGESVTVTTTTTTVVQKKDGAVQPSGNNVRILDYSPNNQRYYTSPHAGFGPQSLPTPLSPAVWQPLKPTSPSKRGPPPVPLPLPPSPSPPPVTTSPTPLPQWLYPVPVQPLAPPLMTNTLEDDHSVVVGLKVYTMTHAPTTIAGKVKTSEDSKETGKVRY